MIRNPLTDRITAAKGQNDRLDRKSNGKEIDGTGKRLLEIDDFRTRSIGEVGGEFEIHGQGAEGDEESERPVQQGHADGASAFEDSSSWTTRKKKKDKPKPQ